MNGRWQKLVLWSYACSHSKQIWLFSKIACLQICWNSSEILDGDVSECIILIDLLTILVHPNWIFLIMNTDWVVSLEITTQTLLHSALALVNSTMALLNSNSLYHGSTQLYLTLPWLHLTLPYSTMALPYSTLLYHGSIRLYLTLPWLYSTLP